MKLYLLIVPVIVALICGSYGCNKEPHIKKAEPLPPHVDRLIGSKVWHMIYTDAKPWPPYHTAHTMADDTFSIEYVDKEHVAIGSDTLGSHAPYNTDTTIGYYKTDHNYHRWMLLFNHATGRIEYTHAWHVSAGAGEANRCYYTP